MNLNYNTSGHSFVWDGRDKSSRELQWGGSASTALIYRGAALSHPRLCPAVMLRRATLYYATTHYAMLHSDPYSATTCYAMVNSATTCYDMQYLDYVTKEKKYFKSMLGHLSSTTRNYLVNRVMPYDETIRRVRCDPSLSFINF